MRLLAGFVLLGPVLLLATAWATAALWFDGPSSEILRGGLAASYALGVLATLVLVRPFSRALLGFGVLTALVLGWWLSLDPSNDRNWMADVARPASARVEGDLVTIQNLRNFDYRSEEDFDERWETRTYDLSKLVGVDMFFSYWGSPHIAHTIVSWQFQDGPPLAISIETRKEEGEAYSAVLGFFRQFELYYVVADERDVVRLRTNHRGEQVRLYRMKTPIPEARAVLLDYLETINRLAAEPAWYNAATHNCTTTIRRHVRHVSPGRPWDFRILVNGNLDELGYEQGTVDTSMPFEELRRVSDITERARAAGAAADFSTRIREGLPGRHASR